VIINPVQLAARTGSTEQVDIARLRGWHLFGEAGALAVAEPVAVPDPAAAARDGIEKGAKETRLALKLRGAVASSEDGLGYAVIESNSKQDIYAVGDKLPVSGKVVLAKVMPRQVVLDNGGTYELLELFEDSPLDSQLVLQAPPAGPSPGAAPAQEGIDGGNASERARSYRQRLYQNPQSLADVVTISAVRENGELLGYRVAPGKQRQEFELLGFKPGDLVTSVNGIALNDPANTIRLYQTMRSASEAVFELQRDNQPLTISVNLGEGEAP
jgi:general secretion pathway protein C